MIFISYSSKDLILAQSIVSEFEKFGNRVWVDFNDLSLSHPLTPQLATAIQEARTFCLIDSVNSRKSHWVQFEIYFQSIVQNKLVVYPGFAELRPSVFEFVRSINQREKLLF